MNIKTFNRNTGFDEEKTLSKSDVGLGNVTNDAQVKGIASSTDNAIVRWDSTTGKLVQNSVNIIDDIGNMGIGMTPTCPLSVKNLGTSNVAVLGNDLVLTGNFETDINWTKGANWTIAGTAVHTAGANNLSQTLALTSGTYYQIIVTIITTTVGNLTIQLDGATPVSASAVGQVIGTLTSYEIILLANITSNGIAFVPDATWEGSIDNVTLKPITVAPATTNFYDTTGLITGEIRTHNQALSNIAIGKLSGQSNTTGNYNTFLGQCSGNANTTGSYNTFLGHVSGNANTTGNYNTLLGHASGYANTTGTQNTFLGQYSGNANTTGNYNTFLGQCSGNANTTGSYNTFLGHVSGNANTTGNYNTLLGHASGYANTTGTQNTFLGQYSGNANTTGNYNTFLGQCSGNANTTGSYNTFLGHVSGNANTTGNYNTLLGHASGYANTTGTQNTFLGQYSGNANTTGNYNTFLGQCSGNANTTGSYNTFLGHVSGNANTTGNYNTLLGHASGYANTTGTQNTFLGQYSGNANTTGNYNTFLGQCSGNANTTGSYNTFLGHVSGNANTTGNYNTLLGHASGYANTTGTQNTFLGQYSGNANTTGNYNTFLGQCSGNANTTGNYNTCIGQGADVSTNNLSNATAVGYGAIVNASNRVWLGNGAANTYVTGGSVYSKSDKRSKREIKDIPVGLNFINKLRPVSYKFKNYIVPEKIIKGIKDEKNPDKEVKDIIIPAREYTFHREHYGLVAQDVKEAMDELGIDFGGYQDTGFNGEGADDMKALGYSEFIAPLIKAVQELSERIILLEERKVEKHD
jgi:hypothetical protein